MKAKLQLEREIFLGSLGSQNIQVGLLASKIGSPGRASASSTFCRSSLARETDHSTLISCNTDLISRQEFYRVFQYSGEEENTRTWLMP